MTDQQQDAQIEIHPEFKTDKNIWFKFLWGMNLKKFSGGEKRLTKYNYRAYHGYLNGLMLFWLLLFIILFILLTLGQTVFEGAQYGQTGEIIGYAIIFFVIIFFMFMFLFVINAIRSDIYRFHDFGLSGWLYALIAIPLFIAAAVNVNATVNEIQTNISYAFFGSIFWFCLYYFQGRDRGDKYGKAVQFRWKSFSLPLRFLGQLTFIFVILTVAIDVVVLGGKLVMLVMGI